MMAEISVSLKKPLQAFKKEILIMFHKNRGVYVWRRQRNYPCFFYVEEVNTWSGSFVNVESKKKHPLGKGQRAV